MPNHLGGEVAADAVKFAGTGASTPRTATWALPVSSTQTYDVYATWVADAANATNAQYTVHYAGGTTMVTMNQTQNGGQWNLLGTFTLDPALNPKVELSDQGNGTVVADAVLVVPSGTGSDRVTYTPTLTSAATVDIYAKWTENANRAQEVTYRIHHAGGSSDIVVNQQQPSGGWYHVGAFAMAPGQNHRVEINGALEGETVADAIRFVSSGVSAPGIHYVHADHLGSPQKMTDSAKTLVWDAVYTPFGQVHSITGTATNNQRFPGQYADAETGFNYNYFRDYDPTTGRYIESDPIGLGGGLNTYAYVGGNPMLYIDPTGELRWPQDIYTDASSDARNSRLPGPRNGPQDAYRHCLASCESARENGEFLTQCIATANEIKGDLVDGQPEGERGMDDHNNAIGMGLGNSAQSYQECQSLCQAAVRIGATINNYQPGPTPPYSPY